MKLSKKNKGLHVQKIEHQDFILNVVLHDLRRYNEPTHYEVAAVFIGEDGAPPANRDVVIYPKYTPPQCMSCNLNPMCYPLEEI